MPVQEMELRHRMIAVLLWHVIKQYNLKELGESIGLNPTSVYDILRRGRASYARLMRFMTAAPKVKEWFATGKASHGPPTATVTSKGEAVYKALEDDGKALLAREDPEWGNTREFVKIPGTKATKKERSKKKRTARKIKTSTAIAIPRVPVTTAPAEMKLPKAAGATPSQAIVDVIRIAKDPDLLKRVSKGTAWLLSYGMTWDDIEAALNQEEWD